MVALSYLDPSARFCRRISIARSSLTVVGNNMARSGVDSGEGVRNAGDASRHAINKRAPNVNNPFRLHGTIVFSKACNVLRVQQIPSGKNGRGRALLSDIRH